MVGAKAAAEDSGGLLVTPTLTSQGSSAADISSAL